MTDPLKTAGLLQTDVLVDGDRREVIRSLMGHPGTRNYVFAAVGALAMIFMFLMEQGSDVGGIIVAVVGMCGVMLRWTPAPPIVLTMLTYLMWTPDGIPGDSQYLGRNLIRVQRFDPGDLLLVFALLVYLMAQYRILGFVAQAIVPDGNVRDRKNSIRRPASLVLPNELSRMFVAALVLVIVGQLLWLVATSIVLVTGEAFPFRIDTTMASAGQNDRLSAGASRFYVLVGLSFVATVAAAVVFGYWKLRRLSPEEGRMILLDTGWRETHRERTRIEKWRSWGQQQANAARIVATRKEKRK